MSRRSWTQLSEDRSLYLIEWEPGSGLNFHHHGLSTALIEMISGRLVEEFQGDDRVFFLRTEDKPFIRPAGSIHRLVNYGPNTAISLHSYDPPLEMTYSQDLEIYLAR